jgi:hypothetical protein
MGVGGADCQRGPMLSSRTSRLVLLTVFGALAAAAWIAPAASADTFCVHNPSGCAGSAKPYEIVHDRVLAYGWRRWLGGTGPLWAALGLAALLTGGARFEYG